MRAPLDKITAWDVFMASDPRANDCRQHSTPSHEFAQYYNAHRPPLTGGIRSRCGAAKRPLRRDQFGGIPHEYVQVAGHDRVVGTHRAAWTVPTASAITQARKRLGREVFAELFERCCGPVAGPAGPAAENVALGTARGSFLRRWRLLGIDGFEIDVADSSENAAEFGYAGSGANRSAFPKARVVALAECGTHAFVAAEVDAYSVGERTLAARLYPRLRADELLTADRGFYSWPAWDSAAATGAALLWRAPTQLELPVVRVLPDGTFLTVLIAPTIRSRRARLLAAARAGDDLTDINAVPDAYDQRGLPVVHLARVVEYDVPDRAGNGTGELITLLSTILDAGVLTGPAPTSWPPATTNAGKKRPRTTSSKPTCVDRGRCCARGFPTSCIRRSGPT